MVKKRKPRSRAATTARPEEPESAPHRRLVAALWSVGAALTFWSFGYTVMLGSDLWWHVASGRWMLEHRAIPAVDPWSFTRAGQPWLHHEWLSDLIYAAWADRFGLESLAWWKWGVIVVAFLLLFRTVRRVADDSVAAFLAVGLAAAVAAPFLDVRPHLYSLVGYAAVLRLTLLRPRRLWALPPLFLVWANLHGGFFFGLLALGAILAPDLLWGDRGRRLAALMVWPICALAALVNPHGWEAFAYPLKYSTDADSPFRSIREWHPPWLPGGIESPLFWPALAAFGLAALIWLARHGIRRRDRVGLAALLLGCLTLAMALRSRRFIPLFAMSQALLLAPLLARLSTALRERLRVRLPAWSVPLLVILIAVVRLAPYPQSSIAFHYMTNEDAFPVDTVDFIETNGLTGKVFAYYNWGGYLHLRTGGALRVYIDGRADTVFDAETYHRYVQVLQASPGWKEVVEDSAADYFLWPVERGLQPMELSADGRWSPIYRDAVSVLLARAGAAPAGRSPPADSAYRFLSLGVQLLQATPLPCDEPGCRGNLERAEVYLERSLELLPHLGSACFNLARTRVWLGDVDGAVRTMRRCDAIFPFPQRTRAFDALLEETAAAVPPEGGRP